MKDPTSELRKAYRTALNGNLDNLAGGDVPVYDLPPENAAYPFVRFGNITIVDDSNFTEYGSIMTMGIEVVNKFAGGTGNRRENEYISDQIMHLIRTRTSMAMTGFYIITTTVDMATDLDEAIPGGKLQRRIITFRHHIGEES